MSLVHRLLLSAVFFVGTCLASAAAERPNLILIMADDFGYECVTANGGESYQTPNLDRLAAEGVRFLNCHSYPLCTPTRVAIMTGKHNVRNYLEFGTLPRSETTFAHLLKEAGYATGVCGKWQLGNEKDSPQHFGFDESLLWQQARRPPRFANPGLERQGVEEDYAEGEEADPLPPEAAPEARAKLRSVLDRYAEARPEALDRAFLEANPSATSAPNTGKMKSRQKRSNPIE